jgi:hypothetical protein
MNKTVRTLQSLLLDRRAALWVAAILTTAMGVYPPWIQEFDDAEQHLHLGPTVGSYAWIFSRPSAPSWTASLGKLPFSLSAVQDGDYWSDHVDVTRLLIQWVGIWVLAGVSFYSLSHRKLPEKPSGGHDRAPARQAAAAAVVTRADAASPGTGEPEGARREALRRNLRLKLMYDETKIDRVIEYERTELKRRGEREISLEDLMKRAIERWERDNRG